ncbi:cyclic nucleotide-binding domain-containing protein [Thermomonospora curvata]|nr:cyclic nucleotide-binding domain-containing protein [Thermomonospora curvata]
MGAKSVVRGDDDRTSRWSRHLRRRDATPQAPHAHRVPVDHHRDLTGLQRGPASGHVGCSLIMLPGKLVAALFVLVVIEIVLKCSALMGAVPGVMAGMGTAVLCVLLVGMLWKRIRALVRPVPHYPMAVADGAAMAGEPAEPVRSPHPYPNTGETAETGSGRRGAVPFWEALCEHERQALLEVGRYRTFAAGSVLFCEGERADHVVVILEGRVEIRVHENGRDRVIAERGAGQLIAERGALQVSVRSTSVVATQKVHALVLTTDEFADFMGARSNVLRVPEEQVHDRLTESGGARGLSPRPASPVAASRRPEREGPLFRGVERIRFNGENCTIIFTDIAKFSAHIRNDEDRIVVRGELRKMLRKAFGDPRLGGLDRCWWEDRGDGFLIIVPPDVPTKAVMEVLPHRLAEAIPQYNRRAADPVQIQLRLAVHMGPVTSDQSGVSGTAVNEAARIVEVDVLKDRMAEDAAGLGVIVSRPVFDYVVRHSDAIQRLGRFEKAEGRVKESAIDAWMCLTGHQPPPPEPSARVGGGLRAGLPVRGVGPGEPVRSGLVSPWRRGRRSGRKRWGGSRHRSGHR